jgi:uncharacterized repeat protein (TIGR01451 family)
MRLVVSAPRLRRIALVFAVTVAALGALGARTILVCVPTAYSVTASAPPPTANWTSTVGLWLPSGGFPGCSPGDSASDSNFSPTTIVVNSSIPSALVGLNMNSAGSVVDIQAGGSLSLAGTGSFASSNTLRVGGGTFIVASGGDLTMQSGASLVLNGGTLDIQSGGHLTLSGATSIASGATLWVHGGRLTIPSGATLNVQSGGALTLDGGTIDGAGTINNSGGIVNNSGDSSISVATNNDATVNVNAGTLRFLGGGQHNGSFSASLGATLALGGTHQFNTGSSVGGAGDVNFSSGLSTLDGTYNAGGTTTISGAQVIVNKASSTHDFTFTSGALDLEAAFTVGHAATWSGGSIHGSNGSFIYNGALPAVMNIDASAGNARLITVQLVNNGTILYTAVAQVIQPPAFDAAFSSGGHLSVESGATISNNGVFDMQTDAPISGGSSIIIIGDLQVHTDEIAPTPGYFANNAGATLKKSGGSGTTVFDPVLTNAGTVSLESGELETVNGFTQCCGNGTTKLAGGNLRVDTTALTLVDGSLTGAGTITGNLDNQGGNVAPGTASTVGTITVTGNYTQNNHPVLLSRHGVGAEGIAPSSVGTLSVKIGPAAGQFDQLAVQGTAALDGAFVATLLGGYQPNAGDTFPVLTYASETGTFSSQSLPTFGAHGSFVSSYTATAFVLTAVVGPSSSDLSAGMTGPSSVNAGQALSYVVTITNNGTDPSSGTITVTDTLPAGVTAASAAGSGWSCGAPSGGVITCTTTAVVNATSAWPSITFSMTAPASGGGGVTNSATVSSSQDGNATNNTASVSTTVIAQADVVITKNGPSSVVAGQNVVYSVAVTNNGPSAATSVVVSDPQPANLTFVSNAGGCTTSYPCSLGTLAVNQTVTISSTYSTSPSFSGNVTNTASVSSPDDSTSGNNSSSKTTNVTAQADLAISKSGPSSANAGTQVTYTVIVTNNGPSPATSVVVDDPTPSGITFVSNSGACVTTYPCSIGTLAAGQSASITSTYSIPPNFSGGSISNTASVSSAVNDAGPSPNSATATTTVTQTTDFGIAKSGPATAIAGQTIAYTVTVSNAGPNGAGGVTVNDATPSGLTFVSNSGACTTAYPCSLGTLNAGQSVTITSTYAISAGFSGASVTNTASVTSATVDSSSSNDSSSATTSITRQADLAITKSGPATVTRGNDIVYTINVTNNGPSDALGVSVSDNTPAGLTFVSNSGACTSAFPCNVGTLTAGQTVTITATYNVPSSYAGGAIINTAGVTAATTDPGSGNNSSTSTTAATGFADLGVTKSGPASVNTGQNIVYTVVVTNSGPLTANNTVVNDPTPAGLVFVSNSGGCSGAYPCSLGNLAPGQSVTITSTYSVTAASGTQINNTATVSSATVDGNAINDSSTASTNATGPVADVGVFKSGPPQAAQSTVVEFSVAVFNHGPAAASNVVLSDPTPGGLILLSATAPCSGGFPCTIASIEGGAVVPITVRYRVSATAGATITNTASASASTSDPSTANNSSSATITVTPTPPPVVCPQGPQLVTPANNSAASSPVVFSWSSVAGAGSYTLTISGAQNAVFTTNLTSITTPLPAGNYTWSVQANVGTNCPAPTSAVSSFSICSTLTAPLVSVVGTSTTGQTYTLEWPVIEGASGYEVQEASDAGFTDVTSTTVNSTTKLFRKTATTPVPFFYRVRANALCNNGAPGPFSQVVSVVVVPLPSPTDPKPNVSVPNGSHDPVTFQLFIPGLPGGPVTFVASVDRPWMSVTPTAGVIGPEGLNVTLTLDPSSLTNGTWTGTVIVVYGSPALTAGKISIDADPPKKSVPVSISLVTPVTPSTLTAPASGALVIPSVGHLAGFASDWRSDVRIANLTAAAQKYQLSFTNSGSVTTAAVKNTTISVESGATAALDDIVRNWYGTATNGASANGVLTVQGLDAAGKVVPDVTLAKSTVVSSRTFNLSSNGTLGQFIPATPIANFIARSGIAGSSILSLQQIAQNENFRTNLGIVEAGGKPASVLVNVFDGGGSKLFSQTLSLAAGEQKQLNNFLAQNGVSLTNGRIETSVTGGDGRVTAYASVVDGRTSDPLLVSGVPLGGAGSNRFVVPGVADLNTGSASWRSDLRVFNSGAAPLNATLTFYPNNHPSQASSKPLTVSPGEVKGVDNVLQSLFGISDTAGALHVTTPVDSPLVVSARTYDDTPKGTLGQFIPAVTRAEAVGGGERALQVLQAEESVNYRTNVGIAEVTGKPATVEVSLVIPDSRVSPKVVIPLAAFESMQFPAISSFGITAAYNVRVSIKVIGGDGKITAYGSVIDMATQAPTFIPAQ